MSQSMSVRTMHGMLSELKHPLDVLGLGKPDKILERLSTPLLLVKGQALCWCPLTRPTIPDLHLDHCKCNCHFALGARHMQRKPHSDLKARHHHYPESRMKVMHILCKTLAYNIVSALGYRLGRYRLQAGFVIP